MKLGTHVIVDLYQIPEDTFCNLLYQDQFENLDEKIQSSLEKNSMHVLNKMVHYFDSPPGAFTLLYLLSESHLSIHTWPEYHYIAMDIFTCGNCNTAQVMKDIVELLNPGKYTVNKIERGFPIIQ